MLKRILVSTLLGLSMLGTAACGGGQKNVEVKGKPLEVAKLAGEWEGTYTGTDSGRTGNVKFSFPLTAHTAVAEVLMGESKTPLNIEFVSVDGGRVRGTLDEYADPATGAKLNTTFTGALDESSQILSGTFTTEITGAGTETGKWEVTRKPAE